MIVLELFAGTRSISKAFEEKGHKTYSIEWDRQFDNITLYKDINKVTSQEIIELLGGERPDVIWASPDCTTYSVMAISKHRQYNNGILEPKTEYAKQCDETNKHVLELIKELEPKYYFIENPRGALRKMDFMQGIPRYTITYCQYGEKRMKPTDIWTNYPEPNFKAPCKNGDKCHEAAPRGSHKTGTQKLKDRVERAKIPKQFCEYIVKICEKEIHE